MSSSKPHVRRRSREFALQFLFGLDFTQYEWRESVEVFWEADPARASVKEYAETLIEGVAEHRDEFDASINTALDKWTPERVGRVERTVLRLALYEMRHCADVPINVAIDEAIELAKTFGTDESARFVNAVLDRLKPERGPNVATPVR